MKPKSPQVRQDAMAQLRAGKSVREVARALPISIGTAINIRNKDKENIPEPKHRPAPKVSKSTRRILAQKFDSGNVTTIKEGQELVQKAEGVSVHKSTIWRIMNQEGLKGYKQQRKPDLTKTQRQNRFNFAKEHLNWTVEDWKRVMFSDETIISRVGSFGPKSYYKRPENKTIQPHHIMKTKQGGGGKIMIWGCMTYYGAGDACWIQGKIDAAVYLGVLQDYVLASRDWYAMDPANFIFQQDNATIHTARIVKEYLNKSNIAVLEWPANSPDLNPIENLWAHVKYQLGLYPESPSTLEELWDRIQDIWTSMPIELLHELYESMPKRIQQVYERRGDVTKY